VKIIVSGGFSPDRFAEFERRQVPVDAYGVGSYLMRGVYAFTADIVLLEGKPCGKVGRRCGPNVNDRLNSASDDRRNGAISKGPKSISNGPFKLVFFTSFF